MNKPIKPDLAKKEYEETLSKFKSFVAETDGKLSNFENELGDLSDDAKGEYYESIGEMKNQNKKLKEKLEEYKNAGEEKSGEKSGEEDGGEESGKENGCQESGEEKARGKGS